MTRTRVAICAPWAAAVRATSTTMRASSSGGVVELHGADERVRPQRGRDGERAAPAQVAVAGHRARAADVS